MKDFENLLKDAYFAGLIDGEGYVGLIPNNRSITKNTFIQTITVGMICAITINSIKDHFNCGTINVRKPQGLSNYPQYYWNVSHKNARFVAERILPFLITKQEAAKRLLSYVPPEVDHKRDTKGRYIKLVA